MTERANGSWLQGWLYVILIIITLVATNYTLIQADGSWWFKTLVIFLHVLAIALFIYLTLIALPAMIARLFPAFASGRILKLAENLTDRKLGVGKKEKFHTSLQDSIGYLAKRLPDQKWSGALKSCIADHFFRSGDPHTNHHKLYREGWRDTVDLLKKNSDRAWLLSPPSRQHLTYHALSFSRLQLAEWDRIVQLSDANSPLAYASYLFITWDLSELTQYPPDQILALSGMLNTLSKATLDNGLIIDRLLIVNMDQLRDNQSFQDRLFLDVWLPFFERVPGDRYRIRFLDYTRLKRAVDNDKTLESFLDVAFFSQDKGVASKALGSASSPQSLLPDDAINSAIYNNCQFSEQLYDDREFSALYLAQGPKARPLIDRFLDDTREVLSRIDRKVICDNSIRQMSEKYFREETRALRELIQRNEAKFELLKTIDRIKQHGITFTSCP